MTLTASPLAALAAAMPVHLPGDDGFAAAALPWNVAVTQRPAAVVVPGDAAQVAAVVRAAAATGLRVAAQGTGHNAGPLGDLTDTVLVRTGRMTDVEVDPVTGDVTVGAGALWIDAVQAAARIGRIVLHGSSPDVGVVGYSLGGGLGWYARSLGLQTNAIVRAEVVLADGRVVTTDAVREPELFWALRGGGGNLGVVTRLTFRSFAVGPVQGGWLAWPLADAERVLRRWVEWAPQAPDGVTTAFRTLRLPPLPQLPEAVRGRELVMIDGAMLGDGAEVLAPLRDLRPEIDTFTTVDPASLIRLHLDPEGPTPVVSGTALLDELPEAGIRAFLDAAGPDAATSLLLAELRQLGGAIGRPAAGAGALSCVPGRFLAFAAAVAGDPAGAAAGRADAERLMAGLRPHGNGRQYLNFAEERVSVASAYDAAAWMRLRRARALYDPAGVLRANHPAE
ncbi:MAG: FAD-binding oxidoreductase [Jatrophihabitans sp.]|uniref:FAD-binding oxidoreductase n=1 Tax=Jatrophihabitans sp. TaxID=1932789 RepID=UPI003F814535